LGTEQTLLKSLSSGRLYEPKKQSISALMAIYVPLAYLAPNKLKCNNLNLASVENKFPDCKLIHFFGYITTILED